MRPFKVTLYLGLMLVGLAAAAWWSPAFRDAIPMRSSPTSVEGQKDGVSQPSAPVDIRAAMQKASQDLEAAIAPRTQGAPALGPSLRNERRTSCSSPKRLTA